MEHARVTYTLKVKMVLVVLTSLRLLAILQLVSGKVCDISSLFEPIVTCT